MAAGVTRAPGRLAHAFCAVIALSLAFEVYRVPVQVSDCLEAIVRGVEAPSARALFLEAARDNFTTLRPLRYVLARWAAQAAETAGVSYRAVFRGAHAAMAVAAILLFVAALRVRTWIDLAALGGAVAVLVGHHTFVALWREGYPINHYAVVAVCCLAVLAVARRRAHLATTVAVPAALALGLLLIESAVLIWAVALACRAAGFPGIRRSTAVGATAIVAAYAVARVALGIDAPGIGAQGSGYVDQYYSGDELRARFGSASAWFIGYNVAGGAATVLFSEPRRGIYRTLVAWRSGDVPPVTAVNVASSVLTTILVGWYLLRLGRRRVAWSDSERLAIVSAAVIGMNAFLVATYIKDEVLGVAGIFYAIAAFAALQALLHAARDRGRAAVAALTLVVALTGGLWTIRAAGVAYHMQRAAFYARTDWVLQVPRARVSQWAETPRGRGITTRLRDEAIQARLPGWTLPRWGERLWLGD